MADSTKRGPFARFKHYFSTGKINYDAIEECCHDYAPFFENMEFADLQRISGTILDEPSTTIMDHKINFKVDAQLNKRGHLHVIVTPVTTLSTVWDAKPEHTFFKRSDGSVFF